MILPDAAATEAFGRKLAPLLQIGDVIALKGNLGLGKTTLTRGILVALGLEGEAPSPSFAIVQPYEPPEVVIPVWHVDLYRIDDPEDVYELGLDEAREDTALIIEWPERLGSGLWNDALLLELSQTEEGGRSLTAHVPPSWEARWSTL